jgi:DNA repair protein RadC
MSFAYRLETKRIKEKDFPYDGRKTLASPLAVVQFARELQNCDIEKMIVLYLDTKNKLIGIIVQPGSLNRSVIYPREIAKHALLCGAASVVLVHNHPSGDPTTSPEDRHLTQAITNALNLLEIVLLDHIIIGDAGKYCSYTEAGLISVCEKNGQHRLNLPSERKEGMGEV